jgi:hypothetical protein
MPVIPPLSDHGPFLRIILGPPAKRWAMLSRVEACSSWSIRNVELELHRIDDYRYRRVTQTRFAFPYLIPLTSQFAPMRDAGAFHDDSDKTAAQRIAASHRVRDRHFESGARNPRPFCYRITL